MGIRQDYAPDADVNVNPANPVIGVRSFGADPQAVARMVAAEVKGYQSAGVAACAKHFPGHGDTDTDSHVGLPYIHHTAEEWERLDAPPFRAAIAAGIDSIMTAHIVVPAFDPSEDPATLSRPILTGILRERLGYDGVVVTDSLGMEGVRKKYGDARVPVLALKAGVDQLLNPPDLAVAHAAVLKAVAEGELSERDIDAKLMRILMLKERRGLFKDPYTTPGAVDRVVGTRGHLATADRIADRTTTLLRNDGGVLPLSRRRERRVLVVGVDAAAPSGTGGPPTAVLAKALTELGFTATALSTGMTPTQQQIDEAVAALGERDAVVVATYNVSADSRQRKLVAALLATGQAGGAAGGPQPLRHRPVGRGQGGPGELLLDGCGAAGGGPGDRRPTGPGRQTAGGDNARRRPGAAALPDRSRSDVLSAADGYGALPGPGERAASVTRSGLRAAAGPPGSRRPRQGVTALRR